MLRYYHDPYRLAVALFYPGPGRAGSPLEFAQGAGRRVRAFRCAFGLTQPEFAHLIGLKAGSGVHMIETGARTLPAPLIARLGLLAAQLGQTPDGNRRLENLIQEGYHVTQ